MVHSFISNKYYNKYFNYNSRIKERKKNIYTTDGYNARAYIVYMYYSTIGALPYTICV